MQMISFDLGSFLMSLLLFFQTCTMTSPSETTLTESDFNTQKLVTPKNETGVNSIDQKSKLTLILLAEGKVFAYEGRDMNKGSFCEKAQIPSVLQAAKRKFPEAEFTVLIKPSTEASYQNTVDILDAMTQNKIERYSIEDLSTTEKRLLTTKTN